MIVNIEKDPRHGLQVRRYHTWRVLQSQSVGEHSAQIMRILLTVDPYVDRHLLVHCVLHDIGEMTGDLPYPSKKNDKVLKERMDIGELRVHRDMTECFMLPPPVKLSQEDETLFKFCEYVEMWEHCTQERNMGNRYATVMMSRMLLAASTLLGRLPEHIQKRARRYMELRRDQESENVPDPSTLGDQHVENNQTQEGQVS